MSADTNVRSIFERYGYDPDDPVRGREVPLRLIEMLALAPVVDPVTTKVTTRTYRHMKLSTVPRPSEIRVLELAACGLMDKEIAAVRGTSINTVRSQVCDVLARLGARNRAHAVTIAIARGLIPT